MNPTLNSVKIICGVTAIVALMMAIAGVTIHPTGPTYMYHNRPTMDLADKDFTIWKHLAWYERVYALVAALINGALFFGITNKSRLAWKLGFCMLIYGYIGSVADAWIAPPLGADLFPILVFAIVGGFIVATWAAWWYSSGSYFTEE